LNYEEDAGAHCRGSAGWSRRCPLFAPCRAPHAALPSAAWLGGKPRTVLWHGKANQRRQAAQGTAASVVLQRVDDVHRTLRPRLPAQGQPAREVVKDVQRAQRARQAALVRHV